MIGIATSEDGVRSYFKDDGETNEKVFQGRNG